MKARPQEPIPGEAADYPWLENVFIRPVYAAWGSAPSIPCASPWWSIEKARGLLKTVGTLFALAGAIRVLFGGVNHYTHIGSPSRPTATAAAGRASAVAALTGPCSVRAAIRRRP